MSRRWAASHRRRTRPARATASRSCIGEYGESLRGSLGELVVGVLQLAVVIVLLVALAVVRLGESSPVLLLERLVKEGVRDHSSAAATASESSLTPFH